MRVPPGALDRARSLAGSGGRRLLGVVGAPGSGKSTLAGALVAALGDDVAVVPMDGFHLAQAELERLGLADVKGAPATFDVEGLLVLLRRLRDQRAGDPPVYAPAFDRALEEPVAGAVQVAGEVPLVVVEGNYLLLESGAWGGVADLFDETWYIEVPEDLRVGRLVARHVAHGRSPEAARAWVERSDEANARLIARTRARATSIVRLD